MHARQVQDATYHISQAAASAESLQELYGQTHDIIGELIPSENLYFALRDPKTGFITYPYYIDEYDVVPPDPQMVETGLTAFILRTGTPLLRENHTPAQLIASSGYANDPVMAQYRSYQFDAVLAKPYSFTELTLVLASLAEQPSALGTDV